MDNTHHAHTMHPRTLRTPRSHAHYAPTHTTPPTQPGTLHSDADCAPTHTTHPRRALSALLPGPGRSHVRAPVRPGRPPFPVLSSLSGHLKRHASNPKDEPPWWAFWPRNFLYVTAKSQRLQSRPHEQLKRSPPPHNSGWDGGFSPAPPRPGALCSCHHLCLDP